MEILIFIFGLMIGSFLNVVIYRLPKKESIIFPHSHCTVCETRLKVIDLIPVLSFLLAKGKCRYCGAKISFQYPIVELLTASLFLLLSWQLGFTTQFFFYLLLTSLLIICSMIDLKYQIIPDKITYPGIVIGLLSSLFHLTLTSSLLGIIIPAGFLLLIVIITKGGMGMGDVKLVAMIGSFIGASYTLFGILIGAFLGSIIGLILIGMGLKTRKSLIPFGPFIAIGNLLMMLWGSEIITWYFDLFS